MSFVMNHFGSRVSHHFGLPETWGAERGTFEGREAMAVFGC